MGVRSGYHYMGITWWVLQDMLTVITYIVWGKGVVRFHFPSDLLKYNWHITFLIQVHSQITFNPRMKNSFLSILPRECTDQSKHALWTQEMTLQMHITRRSKPKSNSLYSLQPKMEKLYTGSKNKIGSWLWLRSWTPYCEIQT